MRGGSILSLIAASLLFSAVCFAQQAPAKPAQPMKEWPKDRVGGLIAEWTRAKNWTAEYLEKMPEDALSYKPVPEIRSFSEQMLHLASANFAYCTFATGQKMPYNRQDFVPEKFKTKAELTKIVLESYDFVMNGIKALDDAKLDERIPMRGTNMPRSAILTMGFEHQTHHRGQTTIYLRLKGIVPPAEPI